MYANSTTARNITDTFTPVSPGGDMALGFLLFSTRYLDVGELCAVYRRQLVVGRIEYGVYTVTRLFQKLYLHSKLSDAMES